MITDPVCGMKVEEEEKVSTEHEGKTYHFCSDECKAEFQKNPQRYAGKKKAKKSKK